MVGPRNDCPKDKCPVWYGLYCSRHKLPGMADVQNQCCKFAGPGGCTKSAAFCAAGTRKREFCAQHKPEGMESGKMNAAERERAEARAAPAEEQSGLDKGSARARAQPLLRGFGARAPPAQLALPQQQQQRQQVYVAALAQQEKQQQQHLEQQKQHQPAKAPSLPAYMTVSGFASPLPKLSITPDYERSFNNWVAGRGPPGSTADAAMPQQLAGGVPSVDKTVAMAQPLTAAPLAASSPQAGLQPATAAMPGAAWMDVDSTVMVRRLLQRADLGNAGRFKGQLVEVFWPQDGTWYPARIIKLNGSACQVVYEPGDTEDLCMDEVVRDGIMSIGWVPAFEVPPPPGRDSAPADDDGKEDFPDNDAAAADTATPVPKRTPPKKLRKLNKKHEDGTWKART